MHRPGPGRGTSWHILAGLLCSRWAAPSCLRSRRSRTVEFSRCCHGIITWLPGRLAFKPSLRRTQRCTSKMSRRQEGHYRDDSRLRTWWTWWTWWWWWWWRRGGGGAGGGGGGTMNKEGWWPCVGTYCVGYMHEGNKSPLKCLTSPSCCLQNSCTFSNYQIRKFRVFSIWNMMWLTW